MGFEALGSGLEADGKGIVSIYEVALSFLCIGACLVQRLECRVVSESTYDKIANILDQSRGQRVQQVVDTELANVGEIYQVVALGEEASCYDSKQTAEQKDSTQFPLALGMYDFDLVARLDRTLTAHRGDVFSDGLALFSFSSSQFGGHGRRVALAFLLWRCRRMSGCGRAAVGSDRDGARGRKEGAAALAVGEGVGSESGFP